MSRRDRRKSSRAKPLPKLGLHGALQLFLLPTSIGLLAAVTLGMMLSARIFHRHGVLAAVDLPARSLAVLTKPTGQRITFTWNESTEFLEGETKVPPEALLAGAKVVVFYRGSLFTSHTAVRVKWKVQPKLADEAMRTRSQPGAWPLDSLANTESRSATKPPSVPKPPAAGASSGPKSSAP